MAPIEVDWSIARTMSGYPDAVWAASLESAPTETIGAVSSALEDLVLATPDLRLPNVEAIPDSRTRRHLDALLRLWAHMGEALPTGLSVVRHVLELPHGRFLAELPVVSGSLEQQAPASMRRLFERLQEEFGSVPASACDASAAAGTRLHAIQKGITSPDMRPGADDGTIRFLGLRDAGLCASFAAARARRLIESGVEPKHIAVMSLADPQALAHAFEAQGIPLSGLPAASPRRDVEGELVLKLLLAKRPPTPAMVLAGIALSPLMPWSGSVGRDLAERMMAGEFRSTPQGDNPDHSALWADIRAGASSLQHLRFLLSAICDRLPGGDRLRHRMPIPLDDGVPDWDTILRNVHIHAASEAEPVRNLEGVSLWSARATPWRRCAHLIVVDFTEGGYPERPRANPLFLDSEILQIEALAGLRLSGRAATLASGFAILDQQLRAVSGSVDFLVPRRDLAGRRLAPSASLSLIARAFDHGGDASDLIRDPMRIATANRDAAMHDAMPVPIPNRTLDTIDFPGRNLLGLRLDDDGDTRPQSPSRLEKLMVSPLAWLLGELGADGLDWGAETLDVVMMGNIAHGVFETVFVAGEPLPEEAELAASVATAFETILPRHAGFLRTASWDMEREALERDITASARRWLEHLRSLGAEILANEVWLYGEALGIRLNGKADQILRLPCGAGLVIDYKKSGTSGRRARMEAGWDLQVGLYRAMIDRPLGRGTDGIDALIGGKVAVAYYLMNDGGLLVSGLAGANGTDIADMGNAVNVEAINRLKLRLREVAAGRIRLNTVADESFFREEARLTPYALTDGSPLVAAFLQETAE